MPTEFEWEWAALGGEDFEYAGCTNLEKTKGRYGEKVKQKRCNGYGLYDMTRVEAEWTSTSDGPNRVLRGGGWDDQPVVRRHQNAPGRRNLIICVRFCIDADKVKS